jgi:hypothetical protein
VSADRNTFTDTPESAPVRGDLQLSYASESGTRAPPMRELVLFGGALWGGCELCANLSSLLYWVALHTQDRPVSAELLRVILKDWQSIYAIVMSIAGLALMFGALGVVHGGGRWRWLAIIGALGGVLGQVAYWVVVLTPVGKRQNQTGAAWFQFWSVAVFGVLRNAIVPTMVIVACARPRLSRK